MEKYRMDIYGYDDGQSSITAWNSKARHGSREWIPIHTICWNEDLVDFVLDIQFSKKDSLINISKDHPAYIKLVNLGYKVVVA